MDQTTNQASEAQVRAPAPQRRRRRLILLAACLLGSILLIAGILYARAVLRRAQVPEPPTVDLAGVDPEVAQAVEEARAEVRKTPRSPKTWGRLGMILAGHDFRQQALVALAEAERLDPDDARWPYFEGLALQPDHPERAIPKLRQAVELSGQPAVCLRLGQLLLDRGQPDEAKALFLQAERADPRDARAQLGLAQVAFAQGDQNRSLELLQRITDDPVTRKAAHILLAAVHAQRKEEADARRVRRMVANLPEDADGPDPYFDESRSLRVGLQARIDRANALGRAGRPQEALSLLRDTVQLYPDSDWARLAYGLALLKRNDFRGAERAFRDAIRLGPGRFESHYELGFALYQQRDGRPKTLDQAIDAFRQAIRRFPTEPQAHFALGSCLKEQGHWGEAVSAYRDALGCRLEYPDVQRDLGQLLAEIAREAAAMSSVQRLLGCPGVIDVALPIRVEALAHLGFAAQLAPEDTATRETLDRLYSEFPLRSTASREPLP
jgi:tetratricopeptide (TPR) repeat protein